MIVANYPERQNPEIDTESTLETRGLIETIYASNSG